MNKNNDLELDPDHDFFEELKSVYQGKDKPPADLVMRFLIEQLQMQVNLWRKACFEAIVHPDNRAEVRRKLKRFGDGALTDRLGFDMKLYKENSQQVEAKPLLHLPKQREILAAGSLAMGATYDGEPVGWIQIEVSSHNPLEVTGGIIDPPLWKTQSSDGE